MTDRISGATCIAAGAAIFAIAIPLQAADLYPVRPVRMLVPYAPGGIVDYVGRLIGPRLADALGQSVVVDNRPGGGGVIAVETTVRANPDGYTLLLSDPAIVINPSLQARVSYDINKDVAPITLFSTSALILTVHAKVPAATVQELIDLAKSGKLTYGSAGVGSTPHMAGELFKSRTRQEIVHVPYKGMGPAVTDLVGGQVQIVFGSVAAILPFIKDGRLRGIASTGEKRAAALPNLPTVAESGFPGYEVSIWLMAVAPAGTPASIVTRINAELRAVARQPEVKAALDKAGIEPLGTSAQDAAKFLRSEYRKWADVIKGANIRPN